MNIPLNVSRTPHLKRISKVWVEAFKTRKKLRKVPSFAKGGKYEYEVLNLWVAQKKKKIKKSNLIIVVIPPERSGFPPITFKIDLRNITFNSIDKTPGFFFFFFLQKIFFISNLKFRPKYDSSLFLLFDIADHSTCSQNFAIWVVGVLGFGWAQVFFWSIWHFWHFQPCSNFSISFVGCHSSQSWLLSPKNLNKPRKITPHKKTTRRTITKLRIALNLKRKYLHLSVAQTLRIRNFSYLPPP